MIQHPIFRITLLAAAALAFGPAQAATMSKADYKAGKTRIGTEYTADKKACSSQAGNARDICVEEAKGKEKVALAELEFGYTAKVGDRNKLAVAKADASYAVAKERCDDMAGAQKGLCVTEAKAVHTKALADAKLGAEVGEARSDAAGEKREADLKVALEKCESLAGAAKTACVDRAKALLGKT